MDCHNAIASSIDERLKRGVCLLVGAKIFGGGVMGGLKGFQVAEVGSKSFEGPERGGQKDLYFFFFFCIGQQLVGPKFRDRTEMELGWKPFRFGCWALSFQIIKCQSFRK